MKLTDLGSSYLAMTKEERLEWVGEVRRDREVNKASLAKGQKLSKELKALTPAEQAEFNKLMGEANA